MKGFFYHYIFPIIIDDRLGEFDYPNDQLLNLSWSPTLPTSVVKIQSQSWGHTLIEFVVGSHPYFVGFIPGSPVFLPPKKHPRAKIWLISNLWAAG